MIPASRWRHCANFTDYEVHEACRPSCACETLGTPVGAARAARRREWQQARGLEGACAKLLLGWTDRNDFGSDRREPLNSGLHGPVLVRCKSSIRSAEFACARKFA